MKLKLSFFILLSACFSNVFANIVPLDSAYRKAERYSFLHSKNFSVSHSGNVLPELSLAYSCTETTNLLSPENRIFSINPFFYVFNYGENRGFIIVSGDDDSKEILGYSDTGNFDAKNIPDNVRYMLTLYANEIASISENRTSIADNTVGNNNYISENKLFAASIYPLLQTQWNQDSPYNNMCPIDNRTIDGRSSYTGCVATAMAQIMKYHNFPEKGTGWHSYTTEYVTGTISADFGATTYDWANMTNTYNIYSTDAQKDAVAKLMFHCGVAVDMMYSVFASGAYSFKMALALKNNFGYDIDTELIYRSNYDISEWEDIIKNELNNYRPVYYAGSDEEYAHAFVCDGYDANSFFHINWGWGGAYDGYFQLSALDPKGHGIGGGKGGYNYDQEIIIGIQPALPWHPVILTCPVFQANEQLVGNAENSFNIGIKNSGTTAYSSDIFVYLINLRDSDIIQFILEETADILPDETKTFNFSEKIVLPDGDYFLIVMYDANNDKDNPDYDYLYYTFVKIYTETGVETVGDFSAPSFYPNPVTDLLFVKSKETVKSITVFDLSGKILTAANYNESGRIPINVSMLDKGLYLLKIETTAETKTLKFYKK
jgi:hypothetical protein